MVSRIAALYKNSFTGLSRESWLLSVIMLINRSGTMVIPFMTLYLTDKEMNRSLSDAGTVLALFGLGSIVGAYFGGRLADKIGFYKVQLITLFGGGIMFIILGQVKNFPLICLCTFLLSMVNEAFRPANSTAIASYSTLENRTRSYSLNRLSINLGWAVGASVGGILASINYELLFWVDGLTNISAAFLLFYLLKPVKVNRAKEKTAEDVSGNQSAYKDTIYLWFIGLTLMFAFCFFQLFTTIPKYFRDEMHLGERYIGFIMAVNGGIIVILEMVAIYILEGKKRIQLYMTVGVIFCALAFFSLLLHGNARWISLLMILLITIGEIASMPFMNTFWTLRSNEKNRGQYAALYTMVWGTAQVLGPFLCSHLAEAAGFEAMFLLLGGILLISAVGFYKLPAPK